MLTDPADVKQVFTGDPAIYHAGVSNIILLPFLGHKSVLLLDGAAAPEPAPAAAAALPRREDAPPRRPHAEIAERDVAAWPRGVPFRAHPQMQKVTLEVIMRIVFGVDEGDPLLAELRDEPADVPGGDGRRAGSCASCCSTARSRRTRSGSSPPCWTRSNATIQPGHRRSAKRRDDLEERDDVLSMLLLARHEDGTPMDDTELRDELVTLLVAGHETTATALAWALERLTRHPDALERLTEEVRAGEGEEYVDAVIRETLRLRPVIPFVGRKLQEPQTIGGWDLPAGARVAPSIHLMHRRADIYPDAAAFRPERWLGVRPNPYTFLPFGGGIRRCLGASFAETEMRAVLGRDRPQRAACGPRAPSPSGSAGASSRSFRGAGLRSSPRDASRSA